MNQELLDLRVKHSYRQTLNIIMRLKNKLKPNNEAQLQKEIKKASKHIQSYCFNSLIKDTYRFLSSLQNHEIPWEYAFSQTRRIPVLYSSCYAAMLNSLCGKMDGISVQLKSDWLSYLYCYQSPDGLFRDPLVVNNMAEVEDWWGWRHMTLHVIMAVTALGGTIPYPLRHIDFLLTSDGIHKWLETRDWQRRPDYVSNEIQNYGVMLQYSRDFHNNPKAGASIEVMFDWLDKYQDPGTGLWGPPFNTPTLLSRGVQTAYHLLTMYFYDNRPIKFIEKIIDSCLSTQNRLGGYGVSLNASACEDIDSIDPLVRLTFQSDYRRTDIINSLCKALPWILINQNQDGGWVFRRNYSFVYGHNRTSSIVNESGLFPTWFRLLSLAYLTQVITLKGQPQLQKKDLSWKWINCPGLQFWKY